MLFVILWAQLCPHHKKIPRPDIHSQQEGFFKPLVSEIEKTLLTPQSVFNLKMPHKTLKTYKKT